MSTIQLDKRGHWDLETTLDHDGELMLTFDDGDTDASVWLNTSTLMTLWSLFDSLTGKCLCQYAATNTITEDYHRYELTKTNPVCPLHSKK